MTLADYPHSWYAATATGAIDRPRLEETLDVDACVIGGGLTGLSAALHLAERGYSVALLEAERVGWGASGRNGGLIGSGQRRDVEDLEALFGERFARQLWDLAEEGKQLVRDRARQHAIDCYLRNGQLEAAWKASHARELKSHVAHMRDRYDYPHMRYIERDELVHGGEWHAQVAALVTGSRLGNVIARRVAPAPAALEPPEPRQETSHR